MGYLEPLSVPSKVPNTPVWLVVLAILFMVAFFGGVIVLGGSMLGPGYWGGRELNDDWGKEIRDYQPECRPAVSDKLDN